MQTRLAAKLISYGSTFGFLLTSIVAQAEALRVSDASIIFPIKRTVTTENDPIFQTKGDGLTPGKYSQLSQAPSLSEGNILSKATFQKLAILVMGGAPGQETCQPTPDSVLEQFFFSSITDLLQAENNVSFIKGITPEACRYSNWKVVGFRVDPCLDRAGRTFKSKDDLKSCKFNEARLVAQPFVKQADGSNKVLDLTVHLIYKIPNLDTLITDLKAVMAISKASEKKTSWDKANDGKAQLLRPHHGLRNEMDAGGGEVTTAIKNLLAKHTNESNMTQIAFMTSSLAVTEWTFGFVNVKEGNIDLGTNPAGAKFDNFSDPVFSANSGFPLNQNLKDLQLPSKAPHVGGVMDAMAKRDLTPEDLASNTQRIDAMNDILNPLVVNQISTTCMSCHMAQQAITRLGASANTPDAYGTKPYRPDLVWDQYAFKGRTFLNFRNFGYGPGFELGVSQRTIHEADSVWKILKVSHP